MTRTLFALPLFALALCAQTPGVRTIGSPTTIDQSGSYILTNSLFTSSSNGAGIVITASDVTLDLNGQTITGPGNGSHAGVRILNAQNVSVRNGNITGALMGVMVDNSSNVQLEGLKIRGFGLAVSAPPPEIGILINQARNVTVRNNSVFNVGLGLFVRGGRSFGNRLENNTITAMANGVFGICYNPADGDPQGPKGDFISGNLIRGFPTSIQISGRSDYNVIDGNILIFRTAGLESTNPTNISQGNRTTQIQ
jgi:hypothetical protein